MRTTITLDDALFEAARALARARGTTVSAFVADAVRRAVAEPNPTPAAFELVTFRGTGPAPGVDLDRVGELLVAEDDAAYRR